MRDESGQTIALIKRIRQDATTGWKEYFSCTLLMRVQSSVKVDDLRLDVNDILLCILWSQDYKRPSLIICSSQFSQKLTSCRNLTKIFRDNEGILRSLSLSQVWASKSVQPHVVDWSAIRLLSGATMSNPAHRDNTLCRSKSAVPSMHRRQCGFEPRKQRTANRWELRRQQGQ